MAYLPLCGGLLFFGFGLLKLYGLKQGYLGGEGKSAKERLCGT
jgi:hypothetical protein